MSFKDNTAVKGQVARQLGPRRIAIAHISGKWSDQILVQCPAKQANDSSLEGEGSFTRFSLAEQNSLFLLESKAFMAHTGHTVWSRTCMAPCFPC